MAFLYLPCSLLFEFFDFLFIRFLIFGIQRQKFLKSIFLLYSPRSILPSVCLMMLNLSLVELILESRPTFFSQI